MKNYTKPALVSSLVLSVALLSSTPADAVSIFHRLKHIAQSAAKFAGKVVTNPDIQQGVLKAGTTAAKLL